MSQQPPRPEAAGYHLVKACRGYTGQGYQGPSCDRAGIQPGKTYETLAEAQADARRLQAVNPVGWLVVTVPDGGEVWLELEEGEEEDGGAALPPL